MPTPASRLSRGLAALALCAALVLSLAPVSASAAPRGRWVADGSDWWYAYDAGGWATGWLDLDGTWYRFDGDGWMERGWQRVGGTWYYLEWSGAMAEGWGGWATGWLDLDGTWYRFDGDGWMERGWQRVGGTWYYLEWSGAMAEGWAYVGGAWYYLTPGSGAMATGWVNDHGTWYWCDGSGAMRTGWLAEGGRWYYLTGSGAMAEGWERVDGLWYYLQPGSGAMLTGWQWIDGEWYYLEPSGAMVGSGAMAEGWERVDGLWYYLQPGSGAMLTGWQWIDGEWYYLEPSGAMVANRWVGDYYLGSSGAMERSRWVGPWYVGADGRWIPGYAEPPKPADPRPPEDADKPAEPTPASQFEYAVGDYVVGDGAGASDVRTGAVGSSSGTTLVAAGGAYSIQSSGGFALESGFICGHGVYITGYKGDAGSTVVIPRQIDGVDVVYADIRHPGTVATDPGFTLEAVDARQATGLRWLSVAGSPRALLLAPGSALRYLTAYENSWMTSFDGAALTGLEVLGLGIIPEEFSVPKGSLVTFEARFQESYRAIPRLDFSGAAQLQSLVIGRRGGNVTDLGPLTSQGIDLAGCTSLRKIALPFQRITTFDVSGFPYLETLILTNDPLTDATVSALEQWAADTGGSLTLKLP